MKKLFLFLGLFLVLSLSFCKKNSSDFQYSRVPLSLPSIARSIEWHDPVFIISGGDQEGNGFINSYACGFGDEVILYEEMEYPVYDYYRSDSMHYFSADLSRVYQGTSIDAIEIYYPDSAFWVNSLNKKALRDIEDGMSRGIYMAGGEGYTKGLIQYTINNGDSWIPYELDNEMRCVAFQEPSIMWSGGYGLLLRSTAEGEDWEIRPFENTFITGLDFHGSDLGILSSYNGEIFLSKNAGESWIKVLSSNLTFNSISFIDNNRVIAFGNHGSFAISYDSGQNWTFDKSFDDSDLVDFAFKDEQLFLLGDNGNIYIFPL